MIERVPQLRLEPSVGRDARHRGAEAGDTPTRPLLQPRTQLGDGYAFLAVLRPRPEELVAGHGRDEVDPADLRIEGEDTAGPLAVRQVEVLGVRPEQIRPVAPARDGDRRTRADQHDCAVQVPSFGGSSPAPLELRGDTVAQEATFPPAGGETYVSTT